ncbi:MAG: hypothetical protein AB7G28_12200 [Pirellulales bacterium]
MADSPEAVERERRGTWWQRFLIWVFSAALALLIYWLLGFVLQDIGRLPGPDWAALQAEKLDPKLRQTADRLTSELADVARQIENEERRQRLLRDSTASSQKTLSQLLELQRMSLEQKATLPAEQQQALAESQQLFIDNQKKDQELNESLAALYEKQSSLNDQQRENNERMTEAQQPLQQEFNELDRQYRLKVAAIKIAVLTPLLVLGGWLFARYRNSAYAPMVYAFGVAVLGKAFVVMHEYFPREYFRYILILSALAVIGWILLRLLSIIARPNRETRLKQYREAYESFLCPVCQYPIRRGPLKFMAWTPRSLRRASKPIAGVSDEPYTCPSCATSLYEKCPRCGATRHALLPACEHCGAEREV